MELRPKAGVWTWPHLLRTSDQTGQSPVSGSQRGGMLPRIRHLTSSEEIVRFCELKRCASNLATNRAQLEAPACTGQVLRKKDLTWHHHAASKLGRHTSFVASLSGMFS